MDSRRLSQVFAVVVTVFVIAVLWDLMSDGGEAPPPPVVDTLVTPPRREGQSQAGRAEPAYTIPEPEREQPGYLAQ